MPLTGGGRGRVRRGGEAPVRQIGRGAVTAVDEEDARSRRCSVVLVVPWYGCDVVEDDGAPGPLGAESGGWWPRDGRRQGGDSALVETKTRRKTRVRGTVDG